MCDSDTSKAATKELLLADLEIFDDAIWRNEETGEKRFNFFVTLVTAVGAGLAALWTTEKVLKDMPDLPRQVTWQASLGLLIFGLLSFLRMRHRDVVTSEYKSVMDYIRTAYCKAFFETDPELREYKLPLRPRMKGIRGHIRRTLQGGYTVSLAFMNGILLTVTLLAAGAGRRFPDSYNLPLSVGCGALLAVVLCAIGSLSHGKHDKSTEKSNSPTRGKA